MRDVCARVVYPRCGRRRCDATGQTLISKSAVSEITDRLWPTIRPSSAGICLTSPWSIYSLMRSFQSLRRHGAKEALLVAWCIASEGRKHLLHLAVGNKESQACWTEFFRSLLARGMRAPTTITSDGVPGLIKAITACFPASGRIRCWFHRLGNIRAKLPDEAAGEVMAHLDAVPDAPTLDTARVAADRLVNTYARQYPSAVACFTEDLDALLAIRRVPVRHRIQVRTTNLAERSFVEKTPAHQGDPSIPQRKSRAQAGVRHHDPRRRSLVPGVDQRPETPPADTAARRAGP
ncbi:MAG: transposase [Actinomycetota bacterium]|nr:transposase [Actinomycetota bacterium]